MIPSLMLLISLFVFLLLYIITFVLIDNDTAKRYIFALTSIRSPILTHFRSILSLTAVSGPFEF